MPLQPKATITVTLGRSRKTAAILVQMLPRNWDKKAFAAFSKPYFDRGKAWDFKSVERNIYFSKNGKTAWFDELLDTWMKGCRGSGVLEKEGKEWKIKHYVLSMTVPNEVTDQVLPLKGKYEDELIEKLKAKQ
jgi:hypothetical protein